MKTLSIQQPWPWAVFHLGKPVENRDWATTFRGRILIHAGKKYDTEGAEWIEDTFSVKVPRDLPTGGIVGAVNIVNCVDYGRTDYRSKWFFGRYGFVLNYATELPFKPMRGQLGFFNVDYIWPIINFEKYPEEFMDSIKRTWSGQDASAAWHWNPDTYQKLGNVVRLISTGKAEDRTKAYHEYIALKRWFFEDEFEEYISKLDAFRKEKKLRIFVTLSRISIGKCNRLPNGLLRMDRSTAISCRHWVSWCQLRCRLLTVYFRNLNLCRLWKRSWNQ